MSSTAGDGGAELSTKEDLTLEGEEESSASAEEDGEEAVAVAQPPYVFSRPSEQDLALTGSTALDLLDQLLTSNKIGKEQAARLRRKYILLRKTVDSSRSQENSLLVQVKELSQHLIQQQRTLDHAASFPEGASSDGDRLRQVLLQHQNELDQSNERMDKLQRELTILGEEKAELEREYSRLPKQEELEQHLCELNRQAEELNDEIMLRSLDVQRYRVELDKKNEHISTIAQEAEELRRQEDTLQDDMSDLRSGPNIPREIDAIHKRKLEEKEKTAQQSYLLEELQPQLERLEGHVNALLEASTNKRVEVTQLQAAIKTKELALDRIKTVMNQDKEREATFLEEKATLELHLRHKAIEYRMLCESNSTKNREKDKDLKQLKKAELQLGVMQQSLEQCRHQMEDMLRKKTEQQQQLAALHQRREEVRDEVEQLRRTLSQQEGVGETLKVIQDDKQAVEKKLRTHIKSQQALLRDLTSETVVVTKSRDHDARQYYKTRREQRVITDDLKTKEGQIEEKRKMLKDLEAKLKDFATAYEVVKAERNKIHAQIQVMSQLSSELHEKTKILQNEIEILRASSDSKEKILQKCSLVHTTKVLERDSQRQELSKMQLSQAELSSELDSQREELHRLTQQINTTEQHLNQLRRRYEQAVQERNDLGLQLIERNEEVCVFYEKINVQNSVIHSANLELISREEELKFLRMELLKLQNSILVSRKSLPEKHNLESELALAQIELKECGESMKALEKAVECASDPSRLRLLPGTDPTCTELTEKLGRMEYQLAEREQHLLEKELLYEQVCKVTERVQKRVETQHETTLQVANRVNQYQSKIKNTTRRMMALVSELSMQQATALHLQQDVRDCEVRLEQGYKRLESGEAPDEDAAAQWQRTLKEEQRRRKDAEDKRRLAEEEAHQLPGGIMTTVEPRPNAYIPSGEGDLPIPRPYGSHAPFKPTEPGANIRHIRKPELKPIDI